MDDRDTLRDEADALDAELANVRDDFARTQAVMGGDIDALEAEIIRIARVIACDCDPGSNTRHG